MNGDGYADVLVAAPRYDSSLTDAGRVLLFHGSAAGLPASPNWTYTGSQAHALLGRSVACAGDVNGDGYSDVVVGASQHEADADHLGRVFVFHGSSSGLSGTPALTIDGDRHAFLGTEVAWAGDVNGDGYDDVALGAGLRMTHADGDVTESRVYVHHGSSSGLAASASWTLTEAQAEEALGTSVTTAGDINGDGYADLAVGAPWWDGALHDEAGAVRVYLGSSSGLAATAAVTFTGTSTGEVLGATLALAGDVNGDGLADLLVGGPAADAVTDREGSAHVYHGTPAGPASAPAWSIDGTTIGEELGLAAAGVGDVDGDGFSDVVLAAPLAATFVESEWLPMAGAASLYRGAATGLTTTSDWGHEPNQVGASFGGSSVMAVGGLSAPGGAGRARRG